MNKKIVLVTAGSLVISASVAIPIGDWENIKNWKRISKKIVRGLKNVSIKPDHKNICFMYENKNKQKILYELNNG